MLRITIHKEDQQTTLEVEGKLAGPWVGELEQCWRQAEQDGPPIRVYLRAVEFMDAAGKDLLRTMYRQGVELVATGCMTSAIVAEITGKSGSAQSRQDGGATGSPRRCLT